MKILHDPVSRPKASIPMNRILWLLFILVMVGGGIIFFYSFEGMGERNEKLSTAEKAPLEEHDFAPPIPPDEPIQLSDTLAAQVDDSTAQGRTRVEEEPYRDLMSKVLNRTSRFMREVLIYKEADHDTLVKEPAKHRGDTYFVRGELMGFSEFLLEKPIGDYNRVHFGVIRDNQGNLFWFETLSFDEENILRIGQIVMAEGVFLKNYKYIKVPTARRHLKDLPDQQDNLPFLICKDVLRSYHIKEISTLDKKLVRSARWKKEVEQEKLETGPLYHLLGYMKKLKKNQVPKNIKTYDDIAERLINPTRLDRFRGEWVELWGKLGPIYKHIEEKENPAGIQSHYRAYLYSSDRIFVAVFLPEKPVGFKPFKDVVMVRGVYFKPWTYESDRPDGQPIRAPLIVANSLLKLRFKPGIWAVITPILVGLLLAAVLLMIIVIYRERREIKKHNEKFILRRRERRLKKLAEQPPYGARTKSAE